MNLPDTAGSSSRPLEALLRALRGGDVSIIDLTHVLDESTPAIKLPPPKVSPPPFKLHELSRYDERGEHEYWNTLEMPEHIGTHFDAPIHWFTGRELEDVSQVSTSRMLAPAAMLDCSDRCDMDPDYLITPADIVEFEAEHGELPSGGWLLIRTGWDQRYHEADAFLNLDADGKPHWPGLSVDCARLLAQDRDIVGVGIDTVGTDAGMSGNFDPPHPGHHYIHQAGKCGMSSLANLGSLPPLGAMVITPPLRIGGGSGSPIRALALIPGLATS